MCTDDQARLGVIRPGDASMSTVEHLNILHPCGGEEAERESDGVRGIAGQGDQHVPIRVRTHPDYEVSLSVDESKS